NWSASTVLTGKNTKDFFDLQFEYPVSGEQGEAGIETDGLYIYTTKWNGAKIYKYNIDGTFVEAFTIPGVSALRDLAYDGTYFYGSAAIPVVYEMDFTTHELIGTFTAPCNVRAIAYNENSDYFYANNYSDPITLFDKSGASLGTLAIGPTGENYYGFAYDQVIPGGPYLWGYAQTGGSSNEIIQIQLPSGIETGFTVDVANKLSGQVYNSAGGLFTHPNLVFGKWTLGGLVQNQWIWGLELGDAVTWLMTSPNAGILAGGDTEVIDVNFDATDLAGGTYNAEILFTTYPNVGCPVVDIEMFVANSVFPYNLISTVNCTDIELQWEMLPPNPLPDSFNVYRNGLKIANVYEMTYTDELVFPDNTYLYYVTAMLNGNESMPSNTDTAFVSFPENLIPENFGYTLSGNDILLSWNTPSGCLTPDGYNVYRDNTLLGFTTDTSFIDSYGNYEYALTAVYYFGESNPTETLIITWLQEKEGPQVSIYPIPAGESLSIISEHRVISYTVNNLSGNELINKQVGNSEFEINTMELINGVYILGLTFDHQIQYYKFTVTK
ncbi:MAG: T9SS type A sorting domain-containing protein, partial [Bacteroidales bacterium]|nr:T9SS type A sorting domain-containing protein [Bacteroidales bacterium]